MRWKLTAVALVAAVLVVPGCGGAADTGSLHSMARDVPMVVVHHGPAVRGYVRVTIGGRRYVFPVDTGASRTVLSRAIANSLRLPTRGHAVLARTVGCDAVSQPVLVSNWKVEDVPLPAQVVFVQNLAAGLPGVDGLPVGGLLGSDVLSRFRTVTFEFARGRLTLGPRRSSGGQRMSVDRVRTPHGFAESVRVTIDRRSDRFLVDTGADISLIAERVARRLGLHTLGGRVSGEGAAGCPITAVPVGIGRWTAGNVKLPSALVLRIAQQRFFTGLRIGGVLGADVLSKFSQVTLDFTSNRIVFSDPGSAEH